MKILMLISRLNIGGTEKYTLAISKILMARGIPIGVATEGGPLTAAYSAAGIKLHILPSRNKAAWLSSMLIKEKYELMHAHDSKSFTLAATLSNLRNIPFVVTVHGTYHDKSALLTAARKSKRMISVSPQLTNWLKRHQVPTEKIRTIPNGIELETFHPVKNPNSSRKGFGLPLSSKILLYAGRFSFDKYPIARIVVKVAEQIAKNDPQVIAVLMGPGTKRSYLVSLAAAVNRRIGRKAIIVRPPTSRIHEAYAAADIVVGTGRVALEAMACGKPVVAVGVAGYCGIVQPNLIDKMIQFHFGDHGAMNSVSTQRLNRDIRFLLGNPALAREWGEFGSQTVKKKFSNHNVVARLLQTYKEVTP
ncbi:glycosyltransferase [Cohnella candidum]|uniref:Glycosyltransferase family 1 protein n=1 Tax=Cohnella candidum TaxID=2674991 RepID=A0A3G3JX66_9BACL|nr:glycosyltransferase [Cohnella candidum]AYQ72441.1 glycosyltransferase family 1 protein [Cohnella candidum]